MTISTSRNQFITIVTGLPRSGTSMMMQMISAGGIEALTDGIREADEDNPRGYLELDRVKSLKSENAWISAASGKVVKIISHLLPYLPREEYRIVFLKRDLQEVLRSQNAMLNRAGKKGARLSDAQIISLFEKQLREVQQRLEHNKIPVLVVLYKDCIENPSNVATEVNSFLGGQLDEMKMVAAVDASLYRQR